MAKRETVLYQQRECSEFEFEKGCMHDAHGTPHDERVRVYVYDDRGYTVIPPKRLRECGTHNIT